MGRSKASTCPMISLLRLKLAAAGRAGDALVPLSPAVGTARWRHVQRKKSCFRGLSGSFWLSTCEAQISKCLTNKGLSLVPDIAVTQLTALSWSTVSWKTVTQIEQGVWEVDGSLKWIQRTTVPGRKGENLLYESFYLPPQGEVLNAISSQTQISSGSLYWSRVLMWRGDPSETSFTNNNNNKAESFKDKKIMGWKTGVLSCLADLQRARNKLNDEEMPLPTSGSRALTHPEHIVVPVHSSCPFPAQQRSGHEGEKCAFGYQLIMWP